MTGFQIFLIIFFAIGLGGSLASVDRPRKPITASTALFSVAIYVVIIYGIVNWL